MKRDDNVRFWRDQDLGGLELRFSRYVSACFGEHTHDAYSVGIIHNGTTRAVLGGEPASPSAGDVVLIPPDEVHSCNPVEGTCWTYHMFYPDRDWLRAMAVDFAGKDVGYPRFTAAIVDDPELFQALRELAEAIEEGGDALEKQSAATHAFSMLFGRHCDLVPCGADDDGRSEREAVRLAREFLARHLGRNVSLDELAEHCGLSRYHLLRQFKSAMGLPPHAWRTQQRIHTARRLLSSGMPIAEVALEVGFTDQSHFTTTFKKSVGATPNQYRSDPSSS